MLAPANPSWRPRFINERDGGQPIDFIPWGWQWGEFDSEVFFFIGNIRAAYQALI